MTWPPPEQGPRTAREITDSPEWRQPRAYCEYPDKGRAAEPTVHERLIAVIELAEDGLSKLKSSIRKHEWWQGGGGKECPTCHHGKTVYDAAAAERGLRQMTVGKLAGCECWVRFTIPEVR